MTPLARDLIQRMPQLTAQRATELSLGNAKLNQPYVQKSVLDLANETSADTFPSALVISAGPSLHRTNGVQRIKKSGYKGPLICADGALGACLRNGLVPDYVVSLDPNRTRVVRWFGDTGLAMAPDDDYFRRQDLDPYLRTQELKRNQELIELVNKHGPSIKAILATSASQPVTQRCLESGMDVYWWNPIYDDYDAPESLTRQAFEINRVPCLVNGGNVGTSSWVIAHAVLAKQEVAVVGMDFSYAPGTPMENTQYYKEMMEMFGDQAGDAFITIENPFLNETWFTDPAYYWYNQSFLQMAQEAECTTYNCTEGGILFGEGVEFVSLDGFMESQDVSVGSR